MQFKKYSVQMPWTPKNVLKNNKKRKKLHFFMNLVTRQRRYSIFYSTFYSISCGCGTDKFNDILIFEHNSILV